jgi:hypothetical protein
MLSGTVDERTKEAPATELLVNRISHLRQYFGSWTVNHDQNSPLSSFHQTTTTL